MQRQRNRIVTLNSGSSLPNFVRRCALGVRQFDRDCGEVADALMASDQKIDRIFGWFIGRTDRRDLVQHRASLSRKREGSHRSIMVTPGFHYRNGEPCFELIF